MFRDCPVTHAPLAPFDCSMELAADLWRKVQYVERLSCITART